MFTYMRYLTIALLGLGGAAQGAEINFGNLNTPRHMAVKQVLEIDILMPSTLISIVVGYVAPPALLRPVAFKGSSFQVRGRLESNQFYIIRSTPDDGVIVRKVIVERKRGEASVFRNETYTPYGEDDNAYELIAQRCKIPKSDIVLSVKYLPLISTVSPGLMDSMDTLGVICSAKSVRSLSITHPTYKSAQKKSVLFFEPDVTFARFRLGLGVAYQLCLGVSSKSTFHTAWFVKRYEEIAQNYKRVAESIAPGKSDVLFEG